MLQIYGQFGGQNSNAIVSRGLACGLQHHGFDVQIYDQEGIYNGLWLDIPTGMSPSAEVALAVGYPPQVMHYLSGHETRIGCFIAESTLLPADWGAIAASCALVCVPSRWNAEAYIRAGVSPKQLLVVEHGLHPLYARKPKPDPCSRPMGLSGDGTIRFLHIAGAPSFRARKGTTKLISAVGQLRAEGAAVSLMLRCGMTDPDLVAAIKRTGHPEAFCLTEDGPLEPHAMRQFYNMGWDALVLPSRAEAFGLCAIEARSQALPVVLTKCSGHTQHAEKWDTIIKHGPEAPIVVNGIPGGRAPSIKTSDIYDALNDFMKHRQSRWQWSQAGADNYYDRHSWWKALNHLAKKIKSYRRKVHSPGLGF